MPKSADRDATYDHLNAIVPPEIKYELHVLLVQHGKDYKNSVSELRSTMASLAAARMEAVAEAEAVIEPKLEPKLEATSTVVD